MSNVFGNAAPQNQKASTSLFGSSTMTQNPQPGGSGLFGSSTTQNQPQNTGLFGSSTTTNQQNQPQATNSLFGSSTTNQPQQTQTGSSLFGGSLAQPATNPSGSSLYANPAGPPAQRSFAERTFVNPQQTNLSSILQSGLSSTPAANSSTGALAAAQQHDLARSRLASAGINAQTNEKTVVGQVETLVRKWDPNSQDTLMQAYLYNAVNSAYAPFYYKNADENEKEWEEALDKKPDTIVNAEGESVAFVPVLMRGFRALGVRIEYQATALNEMQRRLHEMNDSLNSVIATHEQRITVRLERAKRQHAELSQRCLRLAVKTQTLRMRNYPLEPAEETLRKTLQGLSKQVFDPAFTGREEEIWARMVSLRERARWLEEEGKRLGVQVQEQEQQKLSVPEDVVQKTKKILRDYDGQIQHLGKELEDVKKEFEEWNNAGSR